MVPMMLASYGLSKRENEVTQLVLLGLPVKRIACQLGISPTRCRITFAPSMRSSSLADESDLGAWIHQGQRSSSGTGVAGLLGGQHRRDGRQGPAPEMIGRSPGVDQAAPTGFEILGKLGAERSVRFDGHARDSGIYGAVGPSVKAVA